MRSAARWLQHGYHHSEWAGSTFILSAFDVQLWPTDENRKHLVQYAAIKQGAFKQ
jgi:hypothetical protein